MKLASHSTNFDLRRRDSNSLQRIICSHNNARLQIPDGDLFKMAPIHKIKLQPRPSTITRKSNDSRQSVACSDDHGDGDTLFQSKKFLLDQSQFVYNTPKPSSSNQSLYIEAPKAPCRRGHDVIVSV